MPSLEDRLNQQFAPAWKPEANESLVGDVVSVTEREGSFGSYPIVTVRQDDGEELACHAFHNVLSAKLAEQRPRVGERVGIRYLGKVDKKSGDGSYHSYRLVVDRDESVNWANHADPAAAAMDEPPF